MNNLNSKYIKIDKKSDQGIFICFCFSYTLNWIFYIGYKATNGVKLLHTNASSGVQMIIFFCDNH